MVTGSWFSVFALSISFFIAKELRWDEMLDYYCSKNDVDMAFRVMKDDLEGLPLGTHGPETMKGYLLIIFLSAVLHSKIRSLLRESKLRMSLQDILLELSKIRKVVLRDGTTLTTEISKKQRDNWRDRGGIYHRYLSSWSGRSEKRYEPPSICSPRKQVSWRSG